MGGVSFIESSNRSRRSKVHEFKTPDLRVKARFLGLGAE
jgi:hypothetical protein